MPQVVEEQLVAVAPTTAPTDANNWMENMESLLLLPWTERLRLRREAEAKSAKRAAELLDEDMTAGLHPVLHPRQPSERRRRAGTKMSCGRCTYSRRVTSPCSGWLQVLLCRQLDAKTCFAGSRTHMVHHGELKVRDLGRLFQMPLTSHTTMF